MLLELSFSKEIQKENNIGKHRGKFGVDLAGASRSSEKAKEIKAWQGSAENSLKPGFCCCWSSLGKEPKDDADHSSATERDNDDKESGFPEDWRTMARHVLLIDL